VFSILHSHIIPRSSVFCDRYDIQVPRGNGSDIYCDLLLTYLHFHYETSAFVDLYCCLMHLSLVLCLCIFLPALLPYDVLHSHLYLPFVPLPVIPVLEGICWKPFISSVAFVRTLPVIIWSIGIFTSADTSLFWLYGRHSASVFADLFTLHCWSATLMQVHSYSCI